MKKDKSDYVIKSVSRALELLDHFRGDEVELGLSELSKRMNLQKNNVFRLLATLESCNYLEQNKHTDNYHLGLKGMEFGQTVTKQMSLQRCARPVLESLSRVCNETCFLAILKGNHILYLDAVESTHPVRINPRIGIVLPACCSAAGKVLLAGQPEVQWHDFTTSGRFNKFDPCAIADRFEFGKQLFKIAMQGYALEDEESDAGVRGVAAPIHDHSRSIVGAVCVAGPTMRFSETRMQDDLVSLVINAAHEISQRLGYSHPTDLVKTA